MVNPKFQVSIDVLGFVLPFVVIGAALLVMLVATGRADFSIQNRIERASDGHRVVGLADIANDLGSW